MQLVRAGDDPDGLLIELKRLLRLAFVFEEAADFRIREGKHGVSRNRAAKLIQRAGSLFLVAISNSQVIKRQSIVRAHLQGVVENCKIVTPEFYLPLGRCGAKGKGSYGRNC